MNTNPIREIPHYELCGRILFTKARFRDAAAKVIDLPDSPVDLIKFADRGTRSFNVKWHWKDSKCTAMRFKQWRPSTQQRVVDGLDFDLIELGDRCLECQGEFLNS